MSLSIPLSPPCTQAIVSPNFNCLFVDSVLSFKTSVPSLTIGELVKDLPENTDGTTKQKKHAEEVEKAQKAYEKAISKRSDEVNKAKTEITSGEIALKKIEQKRKVAFTALAISCITAFGLLIAAIITSNIPPFFLFLAVPIGINMMIDTYDRQSFFLKHNLEMHNQCIREKAPILHLPQYEASQDLELATSRENAQESLKNASLEQLANSGWKNTEMQEYALLDKVIPIKKKKRNFFYVRCAQLINAYHMTTIMHTNHKTDITEQFNKRCVQIQKETNRLSELVSSTWRRSVVIEPSNCPLSKAAAKKAIANNLSEHEEANATWYKQSLELSDKKLKEERERLEQIFSAVKAKVIQVEKSLRD